MQKIELINRGKEFYLQATIPDDLVEEFGKPVLEIPLRTSDIKEARDRFFVERLKLAQAIRSGRKLFDLEEMNTAFGQDISKLCGSLFNRKVRELLTSGESTSGHDIEAWRNDLYSNEWSSKINDSAIDILSQAGIVLPQNSACFIHARKLIARTMLLAFTLADNLSNGGDELDADITRLVSLPDKVSIEERPKVPIERELDLTIDQMIELFLSEKRNRWKNPEAENAYKITIRAFREIIGSDRKIKHITRADGIRIQDILHRIPRNPSHRYPHLTLEQAAKQAEEEGVPSITKRSAQSHLGNICTVLNWAVKGLYLNTNPLRGFGTPVKGQHNIRRYRPFTIIEMNELYKSPIFTGCKGDRHPFKPGEYKINDSRYWVPLIAPWTGMRLMEICQLETSDIQVHAGINVISISTISLIGEGDDTKAVKTEAGVRLIPIHPELKKLGFLEFVNRRKEKGIARLFPEVSLYKNRRYSTSFSPWFRRLLNNIGIQDQRLVFHSFRHCFRDALRESEVSQDAVCALGGWSSLKRGAEARYGQGLSVKALFKAVQKIEYPGLDISHLYQETSSKRIEGNTSKSSVEKFRIKGKGVCEVIN